MSDFIQRPFGNSPFLRWLIILILLLIAFTMPFLMPEWNLPRVIIIGAVEAICVACISGLLLPTRLIHWPFRGMAALIFLVYIWYYIDQIFLSHKPFSIPSSNGDPSPFNALRGALFIGLPSFAFALWGKSILRIDTVDHIVNNRKAYQDRILCPDWSFYERYLGRPIPIALINLYKDNTLITSQNIKCDEETCISTFDAIHEEALLISSQITGWNIMPFATTDNGDPIYLRPGPDETDEVYITHHDGDTTKTLARSVEEMVQRLYQQMESEKGSV